MYRLIFLQSELVLGVSVSFNGFTYPFVYPCRCACLNWPVSGEYLFIYLFIFLFCFIYVRRIDFESREKENANFCCCCLLLDVGTLTEYKSVAEAFRAKRGSCSCSTAGTQVTCSCCQKIVGANGEFAFVCLCPSLL